MMSIDSDPSNGLSRLRLTKSDTSVSSYTTLSSDNGSILKVVSTTCVSDTSPSICFYVPFILPKYYLNWEV